MEQLSLDPYEEQLFKVFEHHDYDNRGSLDKDGLIKLCETLQLEDKSTELINVLLINQQNRVTFVQFKDALLHLLGNMQNGSELDLTSSPDREVSPKYVYGSKKYGRRSRPRSDDGNNDENEKKSVLIQRSNSQNENMISKKRRSNIKLKRCTSFPGVNEFHKKKENGFVSTFNSEVICTEDMLREAWKKLGVGEDGFLNKTELIIVCDAIGLNKLADSVIRQLSNNLVLDYDKKISFQELLEALQRDETWNEFLSSTSDDSELEMQNISSTSFNSSKVLQHIRLGPDGSGYIHSDVIVDLWDNAGIMSPKLLLSDLGFKSEHINIQELSAVLDKELKGLNEFRIDHLCSPHVALLQAFLTLYQTEIKCLKNILEQMHEEREKLKCDVYEANNRASLLAQEVEDNVSKMELSSQKHVKVLEQRHNDLLKEVTEQLTLDKEQITQVNQNLEIKILNLENEESKLREELLNSHKYSNSVELENLDLSNKIGELEQNQVLLTEQINLLEIDKLKIKDSEVDNASKLIAKMSELQIENTNLRDKHDEMVAKIESLCNENVHLKMRSSNCDSLGSDVETIVSEEISLRPKRRNEDSPTKNFTILGDESPRLGKVRKFHKEQLGYLNNSLLTTESAYEVETDTSLTSIPDTDEVKRLQQKIQCLETILNKHSIELPIDYELDFFDEATINIEEEESEDKMKLKKLLKYCKSLKNVLKEVTSKLKTIKSDEDVVKDLSNYIIDEEVTETEASDTVRNATINSELLEKISILEGQKKDLTTKCEDLESGMGLLRNEYEKCEDYWQNKLEDERNLFEQEQTHNSEKLNEVLRKISEYEEQCDNSRLPTIDETALLEKQFNDLEDEFEDYKSQMQSQLDEKITQITEKVAQIAELKQQLNKNYVDVGIQVVDDDEKRLNLSNHVIESTNLYSFSTPFSWNQNLMLSLTNSDSTDGNNKDDANSWKSDDKKNISITSNSWDNKSMPQRQKRTRQHDKILIHHRPQKRNNQSMVSDTNTTDSGFTETSDAKYNEPKCCIPVSILQNLHVKRDSLEQRCKKLQQVLRQQHQYDEQLLHYSWQQYSMERSELQSCIKYYQDKLEHQTRLTNEQQDRLARNDLLVKDLFVDNAYLIAKNQRLEQQCHMLTQNINTNSI